ncbi:DUF1707 domain-containing protein [Actinocrispum sp. NPDC049592]|uniref:DUF1707 SHOCT-like domain-containing protein n=1 Tax=Actinocrispum sp. NPDC049592 TaxID=3154835 RepID=UPI0034341655
MTEGVLMSGDLAMRLSDDERWEATRVLDAAVADGRITWEEHAERSNRVWAARTRGELEPQLNDLGVTAAAPPALEVEASFSKIIRTAEGVREVHIRSFFGAVILDLTGMQAGEQVHVVAEAFCGKVQINVPHDAVVIDDGTVALGKRKVFGSTEHRGGPLVRISGNITMGNIKVFRGSSWY